jgi:4-hydroxy-2-oxoheptanedioate aldolase
MDMSETKIQIGIWQSIPQPMVSRYLAQMGWDWIILDLQHGPMNWETAYECIHTIRACGARPLVRTAIGVVAEVEKALDLGAGGVVVPMVNTVEAARALARTAKYPPLGGRSLGGDNFLHYGAEYPEKANTQTLLLVQMEHIDAVNNAEEIMALPGVDGCFVGPVDLALSMGLDRHRHTYEEHPEHQAAMKHIVEATHHPQVGHGSLGGQWPGLAGQTPENNCPQLRCRGSTQQGFQAVQRRQGVGIFVDRDAVLAEDDHLRVDRRVLRHHLLGAKAPASAILALEDIEGVPALGAVQPVLPSGPIQDIAIRRHLGTEVRPDMALVAPLTVFKGPDGHLFHGHGVALQVGDGHGSPRIGDLGIEGWQLVRLRGRIFATADHHRH